MSDIIIQKVENGFIVFVHIPKQDSKRYVFESADKLADFVQEWALEVESKRGAAQ